jgi:phosphate transport system protein
MHEHLSTQFDVELDAIRAHLTRMGGMVQEQVSNALGVLANGDRETIERIVEQDKGVNSLEVAIDQACVNLVARRQPTAIDLRLVMAIGKTVTDLERIGDEAKKIAGAIRKIVERGDGGSLSQVMEIRHMGEQAAAMLNSVLDAFVRLDYQAAALVVRSDEEVDRHFQAIIRQLITYMMEDPRSITTALDIVFIAKSVERIGDHCKNIAEDIVYVAKGRDVRHKGLDGLEQEIMAT